MEVRGGCVCVCVSVCLALPPQHFLHAMDERYREHEHYTSRQKEPQDKTLERDEQFCIKHYAGNVT